MNVAPICPRRRDLTGPPVFAVAVGLFIGVGATGPLAFLAVGLAFTATFVTWRSTVRLDRERTTLLRRYRDEIDRVYALPLSIRELEALRIPTAHPGDEAAGFGSVELVTQDGAHRLTMHLRWTGATFIVADSTGVELPRIGDA